MNKVSHVIWLVVICALTALYINNYSAMMHNKKLESNAVYMAAPRENSVTTGQLMDIAKGEYSHDVFSAYYVILPEESEITIGQGIAMILSQYENYVAPISETSGIHNAFSTDDKYLAFALYGDMIYLDEAYKLDRPMTWHHTVKMLCSLVERQDMSCFITGKINNLDYVPNVLMSSDFYEKTLRLFNMGILGDKSDYESFDPYAVMTNTRLDEILTRLFGGEKIKIRSSALRNEQQGFEKSENSLVVPVSAVLQNPELPTGCEVTSLTTVLNFLGYDVDKCVMADDYLDKGEIGTTDYRSAFIGNPREYQAYGCFSPVIVRCANKYLAEKSSYLRAYDISGKPLEELYWYVEKGNPVIVWATINLVPVFETETWTVGTNKVTWYANEHCVVLHGYDKENGVVFIADPLVGNVEYPVKLFEERYEALLRQAVIIV